MCVCVCVCVCVVCVSGTRYYILKGLALLPDGVRYGNAAAELCWANMVDNGRGCFWENDDPMFGARAPTDSLMLRLGI